MLNRRSFFKLLTTGSFGALLSAIPISKIFAQNPADKKPETNIKDALKHPRTAGSMPGKYPGKVVKVTHANCIDKNKINFTAASDMIKSGMLQLTGEKDISDAWRSFVSPKDIIGLKVNPVAGITLTTSLEITRAVIQQLEAAGVPKKNIVIWDRREFEMHEVGFNETNFPGIKVIGTEKKDDKGSFVDKDGKLYGEEMIDKNWYYWADVEQKYDAETMPYMINEGKHSYFSKIVTQQVDKIINIPILKNAGSSVTLCLKNLAYGSISNTGRLHKQLWAETSAEVCAFPPIRDKVVLNIVDGIKGCYNGGPGADEQYFFNYKTVLVGTDPVAVDRIGYEIILKKRIEEKIQKEESLKGRIFLDLAQNLQLGVADLNKIDLQQIKLA
ncbi:MAG: DUF362 domain-containing protein [Ignavibacteriales bacterium]|nr:DUF362 domain-containing protein [Ignavibacteriales bacterium]